MSKTLASKTKKSNGATRRATLAAVRDGAERLLSSSDRKDRKIGRGLLAEIDFDALPEHEEIRRAREQIAEVREHLSYLESAIGKKSSVRAVARLVAALKPEDIEATEIIKEVLDAGSDLGAALSTDDSHDDGDFALIIYKRLCLYLGEPKDPVDALTKIVAGLRPKAGGRPRRGAPGQSGARAEALRQVALCFGIRTTADGANMRRRRRAG